MSAHRPVLAILLVQVPGWGIKAEENRILVNVAARESTLSGTLTSLHLLPIAWADISVHIGFPNLLVQSPSCVT